MSNFLMCRKCEGKGSTFCVCDVCILTVQLIGWLFFFCDRIQVYLETFFAISLQFVNCAVESELQQPVDL